tara:strand:- start:266 stop:586 length:321 start_codon:yes stop_codon:yes gene_type:complete
MAVTDNNGSTYFNLNKCRSFNQTLPGATIPGTPLVNQVCSEVTIINRTGSNITIYDNGYSSAQNGFLLEDNESTTFRGITNTDQVSAVGTGDIYYRTQYFSNNPSR